MGGTTARFACRTSLKIKMLTNRAIDVQEPSSHAWFTQVQETGQQRAGGTSRSLQVTTRRLHKTPAAAQPQERAARDVQVQMTPGVAMQDELAAAHVQVADTPGATQHVAIH